MYPWQQVRSEVRSCCAFYNPALLTCGTHNESWTQRRPRGSLRGGGDARPRLRGLKRSIDSLERIRNELKGIFNLTK